MAPIIGILASSYRTAAAANSFESIATVTVGSTSTSTITFSSIPSTYQHLQLRGTVRTDRANNIDGFYAYLNSDTTITNYGYHLVYGTGAATGSVYNTDNFLVLGYCAGATATSGIFGKFVMNLLDYANTSKYKVSKSLGGVDFNGSGQILSGSGLWKSTSAVSTITLTNNGGDKFVQYTSVSLYGIKG